MNSVEPTRSTYCLLLICCVAWTVLFPVGCGQKPSEPAQLSKPREARAAGRSELENETQTPNASNVEPGTELAEGNFKKTLRETGAKFVVIQVYMAACGPCMTEALHLTEKQAEWENSGVAILGMGMDETPEGPKTFYRHTGERITFPLYLAPWFSEQQEVFATPTMFIYGADGEQLFRTDPETAEEGTMPALDKRLSQLLRGP